MQAPPKTEHNLRQEQQYKLHYRVTQQPANLLLVAFKSYGDHVSPEGTLSHASSLGKQGSSFKLYCVKELKLSSLLTLF